MLHREYAPIPELDAYGSEGVDDEEYDNITAEQRARAEKEISRREKQEALASGRLRPGLLYGRLRQTDRQTDRLSLRTISVQACAYLRFSCYV